MGSISSFQVQPQQVAPSGASVGQALLQRRLATQPQNAQPGVGEPLNNTMRGQLPMVGKRLLQASPIMGPASSAMPLSGPPFAGAS